MAVLYDWMQEISNGVPPVLEEGSVVERLIFKNAYTKAISSVTIRKNEITFESQSASTVAIFKEGITSLANFRRVQLDENLNVSQESVVQYMDLVRPQLEYLTSLSRNVAVIDAINEIVHAETPAEGSSSVIPPWLTKEYVEVFRNSQQIKDEQKNRSTKIDYFIKIITDLHSDWYRLRGLESRSSVELVKEAIPKCLGENAAWDDLIRAVTGQ